jgi:hypothetical protein
MAAMRSLSGARLTMLVALVVVLVSTVASAQESAALHPGGTFYDDDGSVHEPAIEGLVASGITAGCDLGPPASYCPAEPISRAQMAVFLTRGFGLELIRPEPDPDADPEAPLPVVNTFFDDDGHPFEREIEVVASNGITLGCDEGRFCPDQPVTRAEMASFLIRSIGGFEGFDPPADRFDDDNTSPHQIDINRLALIGVTNGCGPRVFCPGESVSREEMASFLGRALDIAPIAPPVRPPQKLVSQFTTYHSCCESRVTNIHIMADQIDGMTVLPGQTFSVNAALGPRTEAKGYVPAPILLDGDSYCCDHPLNIGGGTSQFGTTIYNAIFYGGYEILDHKPHSRYIDRYPLGIEATLGYPWPDVVFRNDTFTPITIDTSYTSTSITVRFLGDDLGRTITADVRGSATFNSGGYVEVDRHIAEADGSVRTQTWSWTYISG